jgi:hypothetical protein
MFDLLIKLSNVATAWALLTPNFRLVSTSFGTIGAERRGYSLLAEGALSIILPAC